MDQDSQSTKSWEQLRLLQLDESVERIERNLKPRQKRPWEDEREKQAQLEETIEKLKESNADLERRYRLARQVVEHLSPIEGIELLEQAIRGEQ